MSRLRLICESQYQENALLECPDCGQYWQKSFFWAAGNKQYVYKVETIEESEWKKCQFIEVDKLAMSTASFHQYLERNSEFRETADICRTDTCDYHATKYSVYCLLHHLEKIGEGIKLPKEVRWFDPYKPENFEISMIDLMKLGKYKKYSA